MEWSWKYYWARPHSPEHSPPGTIDESVLYCLVPKQNYTNKITLNYFQIPQRLLFYICWINPIFLENTSNQKLTLFESPGHTPMQTYFVIIQYFLFFQQV